MLNDRFLSVLGKFLYAISVADGKVQSKESKILDAAIQEEIDLFAAKDDKEFAASLLIVKLSFYNGAEAGKKPSVYADEFISFIQEHAVKLNADRKAVALRLIHKVSSAFGGVTMKEDDLVKKATTLLK